MDLKYQMVSHLGTIAETGKGWKRELNWVSWNDKPPKLDLRDWSPDHSKMGKGLTFTAVEMRALKTLLDTLDLNAPPPAAQP